MKTLVHNLTGLSRFVFEDTDVITLDDTKTVTPAFIIQDLNSSNSTLYVNVTPPVDWEGNKYMFDGTTWQIDPEWELRQLNIFKNLQE